MNKSLTASHVFKLAGKQMPVYLFDQLKNFSTIGEAFGSSDSILILYQTMPRSGHWVALNRTKNPVTNNYDYHFMDSYGVKIDQERYAIPEDYRIESEQDTPYLVRLLIKEPMSQVYYNHLKLQGPTSKVCGRYCAMFMRYNKVPIDEFARTIKEESKKIGMNPDEYILGMSRIVGGF